MKTTLLGLTLILVAGCTAQDDSGPYLGLTPPGATPELFAPGVISSGAHDMCVTFTPDGNTVYFVRSSPDWFSAILYMERLDSRWTGPYVSEFTNLESSCYPFVSPDGATMFFDSEADLFFARKHDTGWTPAVRLDTNVNSSGREGYPSVASSGNLYFTSNNGSTENSMDIYMSVYTDSGYGRALNLGAMINTAFHEFHACISPDETYLVFDSPRPGGFGGNDLYISFRKDDGSWTEARNMGAPFNTAAYDMRPYITADGKYFFFCSTRSIPVDSTTEENLSYEKFMNKITAPGNGSQDIYWMTTALIDSLRSEVLKE